jgi:hypothetical protein
MYIYMSVEMCAPNDSLFSTAFRHPLSSLLSQLHISQDGTVCSSPCSTTMSSYLQVPSSQSLANLIVNISSSTGSPAITTSSTTLPLWHHQQAQWFLPATESATSCSGDVATIHNSDAKILLKGWTNWLYTHIVFGRVVHLVGVRNFLDALVCFSTYCLHAFLTKERLVEGHGPAG